MLLLVLPMILIACVSSDNAFSNDLEINLYATDPHEVFKQDDTNCSDIIVSLSNLTYTLFTEENKENGIVLNSTTIADVDPNNRVVFIIHGWLQNGAKEWITFMKDTYLNGSDENIIVLDWSAYSGIKFNGAFCAVPAVGNFTADLIYNLTLADLSLKNVQINGFSLGAHIAGYAGKRIQHLTGSKIARINSLDAAGPGYNKLPSSERLDKSDASFVQGIHTNDQVYGFKAPYATVDFYVNYGLFSGCGTTQKGCPLFPGIPGNPALGFLFCDHVRSVAYFIESMTSDNFVGVECASCGKFRKGLCSENTETVMGENCPSSASGTRYLSTNYRVPFAKGKERTSSAWW